MVWPMFFILCYSRWLFLIRNYCRWLLARRSLTSLVTIQSWQWSLTIRWSNWKYKCDISFDHVTYYWHPVHYHHHSPLTSTILLSTSSASIILLCSICFLFRSILWHWPRAQVNKSTAKPDLQNGHPGEAANSCLPIFDIWVQLVEETKNPKQSWAHLATEVKFFWEATIL